LGYSSLVIYPISLASGWITRQENGYIG